MTGGAIAMPALADGISPLAALIPALPLLGTVLCGLCAALRIRTKLPAWLSVACLGASFALTAMLYVQSRGGEPAVLTWFRWFDVRWGDGAGQHLLADFGFYIDGLTVLWMLFVTGLATLIGLYASEYMEHDVGTGYCRFFAAFNLFVFSMACLVMADNLLLLYLGWEGVGLCSYLLIGYFYKRPSAVAAAKKAFIVNRIGDLGLALGVFLTFVQFGSVRYVDLLGPGGAATPYIEAIAHGHGADVPWRVQLIPVLFMIGAFGKSAQIPLYVWLPDAMEGPTPVSALIHAATMVTAGVFLIARTMPLFLASEWALPTVAWVGALTALLAATIGMAQFDIKRIMAYSTVSQLGYMFAGLGVLTSVGAASHVFTHAFFKASLFLGCGAVMHGFAGQLDLRRLSGVARMKGWRIVGIAMLFGCLNLAGFPLTAGFFSKDMILAETFVTPGYTAVGVILLITAGLTAYYTFRVFFRVFMGPVQYEPGDELHAHHDASHHGDSHHDDSHHDDDHHGRARDSHPHKGHADWHPHAPGWAINGVLAALVVLSLAAIPLVTLGEHHGWVGGLVHESSAHLEPAAHGDEHADEAHASFFGLGDPHTVMYYVSAVVGLLGIAAAWFLHLHGRTESHTARADRLLPVMGPIARWAQNKWYVDELYDFLFRTPLWVIANLFHLVDRLLVDGLVNTAGWLPRAIGRALRPTQAGALHGYAVGMVGGIGALVVIVLVATRM